MSTGYKPLKDYAIIVNRNDNVAVARTDIAAGTKLAYGKNQITVQQDINKGHRFSLGTIPSGQAVKQYGQPFGTACGNGIGVGSYVGDRQTFSNTLPDITKKIPDDHHVHKPKQIKDSRTVNLYHRSDDRYGTRNYFLVVPVSFCARRVATQIADHYKFIKDRDIKGLDGVVSLMQNGGCGSDDGRTQLTTRMIINYARHPNVGGVLFIENHCENSNFARFREEFESYGVDKPVEWLSLKNNKFNEIKTKGISTVGKYLDPISRIKREPVSLSKLVLGTECGSSDAFSGLASNRVLGLISDYVARSRGSVILSEVPEFTGTQYLLAQRGKNAEVARKILEVFEWYKANIESIGGSLEDNPTPGNIAGGLVNICIKSLGATIKGGTTRIEGVVDYGELIEEQGLNIMQGPGGDLESISGIVASGANIIGFTTGRGTPVGNIIVPTVKIVNSGFLESDEIDYNCEGVIDGNKTALEAGRELLELMGKVASGTRTCAEINDCGDYQMWPRGRSV